MATLGVARRAVPGLRASGGGERESVRPEEKGACGGERRGGEARKREAPGARGTKRAISPPRRVAPTINSFLKHPKAKAEK